MLFVDGQLVETLSPGRYAFWKNMAQVKIVPVDIREAMIDISGQEIMTADKVTLRLNAVVTYRVTDVRTAVSTVEDVRQTLYREAQLVLRAVVGARDLDAFLAGKDTVANEAGEQVRRHAERVGSGDRFGRSARHHPAGRDEGSDEQGHGGQEGCRGQPDRPPRGNGRHAQPGQHGQAAADNPTLMRLRELEVLEKVASASKLNVVLGEKGLAERVVNLL